MNQDIIKAVSEELNVHTKQVEAVLQLLEEGNTVPFIARYRKEKTGALDEDQIRTIDKYNSDSRTNFLNKVARSSFKLTEVMQILDLFGYELKIVRKSAIEQNIEGDS